MDETQKIPGEPETATSAPGNPIGQPVGPATNALPSRTGSDVRTMADNATQRASAAAGETGERVKEKAKEAGDKIKEQGRTFLNEQKERVGSEIETYSAAARRAAERLESESDTNLSSYISSAADQLDRLATRVQERDLGELIDDVEEMARRRPEVFYGGMFVAGLVAARFLKASKEKRAREHYQSGGGGRREHSSYETRHPAGRAFGGSREPVSAQDETEQMRGGRNI
jgi:vacuolar-type H+-ATPase subunit E/Vma4